MKEKLFCTNYFPFVNFISQKMLQSLISSFFIKDSFNSFKKNMIQTNMIKYKYLYVAV